MAFVETARNPFGTDCIDVTMSRLISRLNNMFFQALQRRLKTAHRTAGAYLVAALAAVSPAGCAEPETEVNPTAVEQVSPEPTRPPGPAQQQTGEKGESPKAVDAPAPGVPVSDEAYREMKRKASSHP